MPFSNNNVLSLSFPPRSMLLVIIRPRPGRVVRVEIHRPIVFRDNYLKGRQFYQKLHSVFIIFEYFSVKKSNPLFTIIEEETTYCIECQSQFVGIEQRLFKVSSPIDGQTRTRYLDPAEKDMSNKT